MLSELTGTNPDLSIKENKFLPLIYGALSILSIYMLYVIGSYEGSLYTDPLLMNETYQPFIALSILVVMFALLSRRKIAQIYIVGVLIVAYLYLTVALLPNVDLIAFPLVSLILTLIMAHGIDADGKSKISRLVLFVSVSLLMLVIGGALRFVFNTPEFSLAFGSIYDDENPLGVPYLFLNGIIIYGRYLVVSVSIPIIILFTGLSAVLTENYHLIFGFVSSRHTYGIEKNFNSALTALSCQCEGLTASFPSIVVTVLFAAVVPLISISVFFILMTNILLSRFFMRGKRVRFLDKILKIPSSNHFTIFVVAFLPVEILAVLISVYFGFYKNLTVFSALNISMFIYGILFYNSLATIFSLRTRIHGYLEYLVISASTIMMLIWYIPLLTTDSVTKSFFFILMSTVTVIAGVLSGLLFNSTSMKHKILYFQYLTMMISTLAIVVFYISVIELHTIWPYFGMTEQIEFSLIIWGLSLPFVWLGTNISFNTETDPSTTTRIYVSTETKDTA